jgi:hypothetical protein
MTEMSMSGNEFSDFTKDEVIKLMITCGASEAVAKQKVADETAKLDSALKRLAEHSFNNVPTTEPRVVVGRFHFRLRKAITNSIKLASSLVAAGVSLVAFPALAVPAAVVAGLAGASAVATAIDTISDLFTKMTDEELYVYEKILDIANNNLEISKNLTANDLKEWFTKHEEAPPPDLDDILAAMQKKGILKVNGYGKAAKYSIVK